MSKHRTGVAYMSLIRKRDGNMDRNETEKKKLREWGLANCQQYQFQRIDREKESYFTEVDKGPYIREYQFETLPQMLGMLDKLWEGDERMEAVKRIAVAAAMKNKTSCASRPGSYESTAQDCGEETSGQDNLPRYIYNF